jgi:hypothetical protein
VHNIFTEMRKPAATLIATDHVAGLGISNLLDVVGIEFLHYPFPLVSRLAKSSYRALLPDPAVKSSRSTSASSSAAKVSPSDTSLEVSKDAEITLSC